MLWLYFFVPHSLSSKGDINKHNPEPESLFEKLGFRFCLFWEDNLVESLRLSNEKI